VENGHGGARMGAGRPKGALNKVTRHVRDNLTEAFARLGGVDGMVKWAKEDARNRGEFYRLYAKLLPMEKNLPETKEESQSPHVVMVNWDDQKEQYSVNMSKEAYENQDNSDLIFIKTAIADH
tara:strand:- start:2596 stop:2964 length:369 start_codon:yes stop_codon:yes gene_type:complete